MICIFSSSIDLSLTTRHIPAGPKRYDYLRQQEYNTTNHEQKYNTIIHEKYNIISTKEKTYDMSPQRRSIRASCTGISNGRTQHPYTRNEPSRSSNTAPTTPIRSLRGRASPSSLDRRVRGRLRSPLVIVSPRAQLHRILLRDVNGTILPGPSEHGIKPVSVCL